MAFLALLLCFPSPGITQLIVKLLPVVVVTGTFITMLFRAGFEGIAVKMPGSATNCPESNMSGIFIEKYWCRHSLTVNAKGTF